MHLGFVEQVEEGGIRWPGLEVQAKSIVSRVPRGGQGPHTRTGLPCTALVW